MRALGQGDEFAGRHPQSGDLRRASGAERMPRGYIGAKLAAWVPSSVGHADRLPLYAAPALGADRPNLGMPEHLLAVSQGVGQAGRMFLAAN